MASGYEPYIWSYFLEKIGNSYGVAGLMGNLKHESGMYPDRLQGDIPYSQKSRDYTAKVDSGAISKNDFVNNGPGGGGYGLAQWTYYVRKRRLYEKWKNDGYSSIGSIELACDYLWWELENSYKGVLNVLKNATSVKEASNKVLFDFENPANQSTSVQNQRAASGQEYYDQFNGQTVDPSIPDQPGDENEDDYPDHSYESNKMDLMMIILSSRRRRGRVV